jgi:hypothetical protein
LQLVYQGDGSAPLNVGFRTFVGGRFGGDRVTLEPSLRYRIGDRFSSEFAYNHNSFDLPVENGDFTADLWRMRLSYSFSPRVLLQMLMQYSGLSRRQRGRRAAADGARERTDVDGARKNQGIARISGPVLGHTIFPL